MSTEQQSSPKARFLSSPTSQAFRKPERSPDSAVQQTIEQLFPDGLSNHGLTYLYWQMTAAFPLQASFYDEAALGAMRSHAIDLVLELVRRYEFRDPPSRYQSIFCWESLDDAKRFASQMTAGRAPVWEIEGEAVNRGDMNLLGMSTALATWDRARRYWRREALASHPPLWEIAVAPVALVRHRTL